MKRFHVVGRKNHGKTQLVVELVQEFSDRGLKVGTIKHTHHLHELDTPGKDSHRHRTAGAAMVGILSRSMSGIFIPSLQAPAGEDRYASLGQLFGACDLVIVEGDSLTRAPKIEVWRAGLGTKPLAAEDSAVLAVVTDDAVDIDAVVHTRADVPKLATWIEDGMQDGTLLTRSTTC